MQPRINDPILESGIDMVRHRQPGNMDMAHRPPTTDQMALNYAQRMGQNNPNQYQYPPNQIGGVDHPMGQQNMRQQNGPANDGPYRGNPNMAGQNVNMPGGFQSQQHPMSHQSGPRFDQNNMGQHPQFQGGYPPHGGNSVDPRIQQQQSYYNQNRQHHGSMGQQQTSSGTIEGGLYPQGAPAQGGYPQSSNQQYQGPGHHGMPPSHMMQGPQGGTGPAGINQFNQRGNYGNANGPYHEQFGNRQPAPGERRDGQPNMGMQMPQSRQMNGPGQLDHRVPMRQGPSQPQPMHHMPAQQHQHHLASDPNQNQPNQYHGNSRSMMGRDSGRSIQQTFQMPLSPESVIKKLDPLFREWSSKRFDTHSMNDITVFARDQYEHASLIVNQIITKMESKYIAKEDEPFINIIHEIITNVQGNYVQYFGEQLKYLFSRIWKQTSTSAEFIKLLKMFHIWYMFFDRALLDSIKVELNLQSKESSFLTDEHWLRINYKKKEFKPNLNFLPSHLIKEGKFICSENKRHEVLREFESKFYNGGQAPGGGYRRPHEQQYPRPNQNQLQSTMMGTGGPPAGQFRHPVNPRPNLQVPPDDAGVNELLGLLNQQDRNPHESIGPIRADIRPTPHQPLNHDQVPQQPRVQMPQHVQPSQQPITPQQPIIPINIEPDAARRILPDGQQAQQNQIVDNKILGGGAGITSGGPVPIQMNPGAPSSDSHQQPQLLKANNAQIPNINTSGNMMVKPPVTMDNQQNPQSSTFVQQQNETLHNKQSQLPVTNHNNQSNTIHHSSLHTTQQQQLRVPQVQIQPPVQPQQPTLSNIGGILPSTQTPSVQQSSLPQQKLPQQPGPMGNNSVPPPFGPTPSNASIGGNHPSSRANAQPGFNQNNFGQTANQQPSFNGHRFPQGGASSQAYLGPNQYRGPNFNQNQQSVSQTSQFDQSIINPDLQLQIESSVKGQGGFLSFVLGQYDKYHSSQRTICEEEIYQKYHRQLYHLLMEINRNFLQSGQAQRTVVNSVQFKRFGMLLEQLPGQQQQQQINSQTGIINPIVANKVNVPPLPRHMLSINSLRFALMQSGSRDHQILKELNIIAITQLYQSIKFQCSNCGLRFLRNMDLKVHLDQHFAENNEIRKRKKIGPSMYPNLAVAVDAGAVAPGGAISSTSGINSQVGVHAENRPLFQSFQGWIQQGKGATGCMKAKSEVQANVELKNIVPYSKKDKEDCCFMCKEKLKIERDQCISSGNQLEIQGGSAQHPSQIDENCYFIDAKRIRISVRNKKTDKLEKQEVTVHIDCFKQLEKIKSQNQKKKAQGQQVQGGVELLKKRPLEPTVQVDSQQAAKRFRSEPQDVLTIKNNCSKLLAGLYSAATNGESAVNTSVMISQDMVPNKDVIQEKVVDQC